MSGGSGHVRRRSPGTWQIVVETGRDAAGARQRTIKTVKGTRRDADRELAALVHQFETGTLLITRKVTFNDFAARWLRDYAKTNVSPSCYQRYASIIRLHLLPAFGSLSLEQIRPAHILEAEAKWLTEGRQRTGGQRGLSAKSVVVHHILLSEMFSAALKWGLMARNPCDAVDRPRPERKEMKALDVDQARVLLDVLKDRPFGRELSLLLGTGLRAGELLGLRWSDVDFQARRLVVSQQLQRVGTEWIARHPKTKAGRRAVSLDADLIALLRAHKARQNEHRLHAGQAWASGGVDADLVFTDEIGRHLSIDKLHHALKKALAAGGLPDVRLHDLRHSQASILLGLGVHPKIVQARLGHASFAVTMDLYSHVTAGMDADASDAFGDALRGRATG